MFAPVRPIYSVARLREVEALALPDAQPPLMERAGAAAAGLAAALLPPCGRVLIACGPGNNGGDGFVLARHLRAAGHTIDLLFRADPARLPDDAAAARQAWLAAGGSCLPEMPTPPTGGWNLVVDALFGIGLQRPLEGPYAHWIEALNAQPGLRLALDLPSGLDADTGRRRGTCFQATHTLTFIALKPGLLTLDGPDQCGLLALAPIDVDAEALAPAEGRELGPPLFQPHLVPRQRNSHKGSHGDAGILGGAPGMLGAVLLAGRAALHMGAGRVLVGLPDPALLAVDPLQPELMFRGAGPLLADVSLTALAVGPGLGQSSEAAGLVRSALSRPLPLVLDADALNLIAADSGLAKDLHARRSPTLLTPHPAEAARLLAGSTAEVQANRIAAALELARRYNSLIVLKGCGSVLATPDGQWWINTTGNPAMASAGMGDVLSGILVALLAQGWPALAALQAAVHLHACAADLLCAGQALDRGLCAGEIAAGARQVFNQWIREGDRAHAP